jgi:hypothetical protein
VGTGERSPLRGVAPGAWPLHVARTMDFDPLHPSVRRSLAALAAAGTLTVAGCDRGAPADAATQSSEAVADGEAAAAAVADTAAAAAASEPLPERIYFDLTRHDWYARGEPLVYSDVRYEAGRDLLAAPLSAMRKLGEYQGVDVYGAADAAEDSTLYVPVHPGYWLPFTRTGAATANGG